MALTDKLGKKSKNKVLELSEIERIREELLEAATSASERSEINEIFTRSLK